jgi:alkyldihydroxyacetonephosphate synthase
VDAPWYGWTEHPPELPGGIRRLIEAWAGPGEPAATAPAGTAPAATAPAATAPARAAIAPVAESAVRLAPSRLPAQTRDALAAVVGAGHVDDGGAVRLRHTRGKSTVDLIRIRAGDATDAPDAVVLPGSAEEILAVLRTCAAHRVAVVPYGGGTSVVGGLTAARTATAAGSASTATAAVIALDLRRLDRLLAVDPPSRLAVLEAGVRAPRAAELLAAHGLTLGHVPQSWEYATIGGFAATRSSGQASAGYGRFDAMVAGLTVATPHGILRTGCAPASAAGPDLRQLFLGSEGALGVITDVTVRVRPLPEVVRYEGWALADFAGGIDAVRRLVQRGPAPAVVRLSDETEAALNAGVAVIIGYEGSAAEVAAQSTAVGEALGSAGGRALGPEAGEAWRARRFEAPRLRDALLAAGVFAETLETAAFWSGLPGLYHAVRSVLMDGLTRDGVPPLVLCHVSHVYETGASLYFTVAAPSAADVAAAWPGVKAATLKAIHGARGTVTHHHGVGRDHLAGYADELGGPGVDLLRAIKRHLDPDGILNPGVLVP